MKKQLAARSEGFKLRKKPFGTGPKRPTQDEEEADDDQKVLESKTVMSAAEDSSRSNTFSAGRFHDLGLAESVADHLHGRMGFTAPTHIQQEAIPVILSGKDVLVNAGTGTGKTLVYLAPIVNALQGNKKRINRTDGTYALVLVPTRELCVQVFSVVEKLVHRFIWLVPGSLMGGENRAKEKARLRKGVTILIATPGRLLDHLKNTNSFKLDNLRWLVFDEADRLLDMGFEKDVRSILSLLDSRQLASNPGTSIGALPINHGRQNILLSATLNEHVNQLAELSLRDPITVGLHTRETTRQSENGETSGELRDHDDDIDEDDQEGISDGQTGYNIPSQLKQCYYKVPSKLRLVALLALLRQRSQNSGTGKLVVFLSTCDAVDFHFLLLQEFHLPTGVNIRTSKGEAFLESKVFRLHGNMLQKERIETFQKFGQASAAVLVCTDVASRGLDFKGVTCIVQYDPPGDAAEYVHRVGRTARLGQAGEAILFLQPCEIDYLDVLQKHSVTLKELPLPKLLDVLPTDRKRKQSDEFNAVETHPVASYMHLALETFVSKKERNALAAKAFGSYVRAYSAHKAELKPIFQVHKLHLGHVAKSFGLNSAPSVLGKMGKRAPKSKEQLRTQYAKDSNVQGGIKKRQRLHAATMEE
ncbi:unnamed protein product [Calypogeia fissa]